MTRARKVDGNQAEIVAALRAAGCWVDDTSRFGGGFPDLVVADRYGRVWLVEVKTPSGRLTEAEVEYVLRRVMPGYRIYTDAQQAAEAINGVELDNSA